ncbi:hypothetical protein BC936DRAFT_149120 [Jimgerdemannia flammicorona]|uniref:Uncharacterized protein n=1 Tax=Jimgerdemannia flammicorona TaxID=994334 RepID=A0A433D1I2_9FUNG|nr:hypothetical protein BC936DRAFT_149120 [Jimgerdemannia flammicorona]
MVTYTLCRVGRARWKEHARDGISLNCTNKLISFPSSLQPPELDVRCTGIDGIEAIKSSLAAGEACSTDEVLIKVYLAAPYYVLTVDTLDKKQGFDAMAHRMDDDFGLSFGLFSESLDYGTAMRCGQVGSVHIASF